MLITIYTVSVKKFDTKSKKKLRLKVKKIRQNFSYNNIKKL